MRVQLLHYLVVIRSHGTESVSYTHLDVYKRQGLSCIRASFMSLPHIPISVMVSDKENL